MPSISVIIPAFNEEELLGRTLSAIAQVAQALGEPFDVIVVDDASTDRTAPVARERGARVVSVSCRQIAATRNAGARAAAGDVFIFVDADTIVSEAAVRAAIAATRDGAVGGGCAFRFDDQCLDTGGPWLPSPSRSIASSAWRAAASSSARARRTSRSVVSTSPCSVRKSSP